MAEAPTGKEPVPSTDREGVSASGFTLSLPPGVPSSFTVASSEGLTLPSSYGTHTMPTHPGFTSTTHTGVGDPSSVPPKTGIMTSSATQPQPLRASLPGVPQFQSSMPGMQPSSTVQLQPHPITIWEGIMEMAEEQNNIRQTRQVACTVTTTKSEIVSEIKPSRWPQRMTMNAYPMTVFSSITRMMNFQPPSPIRTVTFNFMESPQNVTMLMSSDQHRHFAIVQLVGAQQVQCPIKALILVWNDKQKQFTGLIHLDQDEFVRVVKQVLMQRKLAMQQSGGIAGAMNPSGNLGMSIGQQSWVASGQQPMVTQVTSQGLPVSAGIQAAAGGMSATGGMNPIQAMQQDPGMQPTSQQQKQGAMSSLGMSVQQQQQNKKQEQLDKIILYLERVNPQQQEALFQRIHASPETRQQLLSRVQNLRTMRQQHMQQQSGGIAGAMNSSGNLGMSIGQQSWVASGQQPMVTQVTSQGLPVSAGVQAAAGGTSATGGKNPMTQDLQAMQRDPGMQPTSQQQKQGQPEPASKSKHLFNKAIKEGHVKSRSTVTVFVGAAGSGKTCSKHVLMNENPPEVRVSTPMAERPVKVMKILTIDGLKWHRLSPADQKKILAKFMVNIPAEVDEASAEEASDEEAILTSITDQADAMKSSLKAPLKRSHSGKSLSAQSSKRAKQDKSAGVEQVEALLESSTTETEFARLIELLSGTEAPLDVNLVYITDSGGQPQFHEVLPIFLRRTSVYIFVMKLSESLDEQPLIKYFDDNGNILCEPYPAAHTNVQILRHCIRTMQSHKFKRTGGKAPNLVFIGTHKDQEHLCSETREVKNQKLAEILLPEFQNEVVYSNLANKELIFPLNAKSPGEEGQKVAEEIRKLIMSVCTAEPDDIPLRWYCLELKVQEIAQALGRGVMSKEECFAVARTLHFDTESFEAALQYLDELNLIFYYPDILPDTVFTDSQVLIAKASELVKFSYESRNKDAGPVVMARKGECRKFQECALVTVGFLKSFDEHYVDHIFTPNDLVKLFRALLVFADFSDSEYFMPCLLQIISSEEVAKHRVCSSAATVPLILHFPPGVPPLGIFCSLVVYLLSASNHSPSPWKLVVDRSTTPLCLHRNCVQFRIPQYPGTITLVDSFDFFEVHVASSSKLSPQLCSHAREALLTGLKRAISNIGYDSQPELAFLCPCSRESLHPASIGVGECCWICTQDPETYGDIDEKQQMWLATSASLCSSTTSSSSGVSATTTASPSVLVPMRPLPSPPPPSSTAATGSGTARPRIGLDLESVDGTTVLGEDDDLRDVMSAVVDLAGRWQNLGSSLRLRQGELFAIHSASAHSPSDCLRKMLILWLRQSYNVERFGNPTWRRLVEAVEDRVGGNNCALAQRIASEHPAAQEALPSTPH